ncbi:hypothetical protein ACTD5D_40215 [Nocardia takedensis]|uniref:hypothetical protein n=1 Tax=Nocardia takedensis TaxID=259390 RepID=UPI003F75C6EB
MSGAQEAPVRGPRLWGYVRPDLSGVQYRALERFMASITLPGMELGPVVVEHRSVHERPLEATRLWDLVCALAEEPGAVVAVLDERHLEGLPLPKKDVLELVSQAHARLALAGSTARSGQHSAPSGPAAVQRRRVVGDFAGKALGPALPAVASAVWVWLAAVDLRAMAPAVEAVVVTWVSAVVAEAQRDLFAGVRAPAGRAVPGLNEMRVALRLQEDRLVVSLHESRRHDEPIGEELNRAARVAGAAMYRRAEATGTLTVCEFPVSGRGDRAEIGRS